MFLIYAIKSALFVEVALTLGSASFGIGGKLTEGGGGNLKVGPWGKIKQGGGGGGKSESIWGGGGKFSSMLGFEVQSVTY